MSDPRSDPPGLVSLPAMSRVSSQVPARHPASGDPIAGVALVTLERAEVLNALDAATLAELVAVLRSLDADEACRCIVLTGAGERAFAAGADIREMADLGPDDIGPDSMFGRWDDVAALATPIVAAVRGYALGGGCELAMACDIVVAAEDAVFGQPEVALGIIPGVGGTQRLTRAAGRARAMEVILTGRRFSAREAEAWGLVSVLAPSEAVLGRALETAGRVAAQAPLAVRAAKEAVRAAHELPLSKGIAVERELFRSLFGTRDQEEGMRAFLEKRPPAWSGE
jgi:enoyl-CoA hydratase/carnithine racemase